MDLNKNYYLMLGISKDSTFREIKKAYYNIAKIVHPDKNNKESDPKIFSEMTEAYDILINTYTKSEYDLKSKWGNNYNDYYDLFNINFDVNYQSEKDRLEKFKKNEIYNIQIEVDDNFSGSIEYERWVKCKKCDGTGKDSLSKIVIKDKNGNIVKTFDGEDGCDFCDGLGKDYIGNNCSFCSGNGKIGLNTCSTCGGERRILGKQKLKNIKITGESTKIESMGHFSKDGKVGYLLILSRSN
jgi:DnaJ-class molecular chaperone